MTPSRPSSPERRRFARVALDARAEMFSRSVADLVAGAVHDISLGGLFLKTADIRPVGTRISLRIDVPTAGVTVEAKGVVVRAVTADERHATELPLGMGIMFTELDGPSRAALGRLVDAALGAASASP